MRNYIKKVKVIKPISHIIADSNYSVFHYTDGTSKMFSITLGKLENEGVRIHKSVIVNPDEIRQILNYDTFYQVQMRDGSIHPVSRRKAKGFIDHLDKLTEAIKQARQTLTD